MATLSRESFFGYFLQGIPTPQIDLQYSLDDISLLF